MDMQALHTMCSTRLLSTSGFTTKTTTKHPIYSGGDDHAMYVSYNFSEHTNCMFLAIPYTCRGCSISPLKIPECDFHVEYKCVLTNVSTTRGVIWRMKNQIIKGIQSFDGVDHNHVHFLHENKLKN